VPFWRSSFVATAWESVDADFFAKKRSINISIQPALAARLTWRQTASLLRHATRCWFPLFEVANLRHVTSLATRSKHPPMPNLTEQEKQEILRFIETDKPLPDKYRFLLFDDKREVELVWNGKTADVCNIVMPFQTIEQVDEPREEKPGDASKVAEELFAVKFVDIFGNDTMTIVEVSG